MALEEGMVVTLSGDVSGLNTAIEAAKARIAEAQDAIGGLNDVMKAAEWDKFSNGASYTKEVMKPLQAEIASTKTGVRLWTTELKAAEDELKNLQSATKGMIGPNQSATSAQMAFNRVVRDSHSLLYSTNRGIAELTYAIPNFISRASEAAEAGGGFSSVLKVMSASMFSMPTLMMAGGTALAFWLRSHHEAKKEVEDLSFSVETESKVINEAKNEYTKARSEVDMLKERIALAKQGFLDKSEVLKEYNDTIGKTIGHTKSLDEAEQMIVKNGEAFVKMELYKAVASKAREEAAKAAFEIAKKQMADESKMGGAAINVFKPGMSHADLDKQLSNIDKMKKAGQDMIQKKGDKEVMPWENMAKKYEDEAAKIAKDRGFNFFGGKEDVKEKKYSVTKEKEDKIKLNPESEVEKIKVKLEIDLDKKDQLAAIFRESGIDETKQKLGALKTALSGLLGILDKPQKGNSIERAFQALEKYKAENLIPKLTHDVQVLQAMSEKKITNKGLPQWAADMKAKMDEVNKTKMDKLKENLAAVDGIVKDIGSSFQGLFEGIITGSGNAMQSFLKSIEKMIAKIIAAIAVAAVLAALLAITGLGAVTSLATNSFKGLLSGLGKGMGVPFMASGGVTTGATLAMIGEGKEREAVLPLSRLNAMLHNASGGGNGMTLTHRISGSDLLLTIDRASRERGRSY